MECGFPHVFYSSQKKEWIHKIPEVQYLAASMQKKQLDVSENSGFSPKSSIKK